MSNTPETKEVIKSNRKSAIKWTQYLACAYAEGFMEGANATLEEEIEAWSYIIEHKIYLTLQGFYGRNVKYLVSEGLIDENGVINWDNIKNYKQDK